MEPESNSDMQFGWSQHVKALIIISNQKGKNGRRENGSLQLIFLFILLKLEWKSFNQCHLFFSILILSVVDLVGQPLWMGRPVACGAEIGRPGPFDIPTHVRMPCIRERRENCSNRELHCERSLTLVLLLGQKNWEFHLHAYYKFDNAVCIIGPTCMHSYSWWYD